MLKEYVLFPAKTEIPLVETMLSSRFQPGMTESYMATDDNEHTCAITENNSASRWWAGKLANKTIVTHVEVTTSLSYEGDYSKTKHIYDYNRLLTHLPLDKMAANSQTIYSDAFSWMKIIIFWEKFHWSLFLRVQLTIIQHWFR